MSLDEAVDLRQRAGAAAANGPTRAGPASPRPSCQVVELVAEGLRNDTIATRLYLSPGTVKNHLSHIFTKLGVDQPRRAGRRGAAPRARDPRGRTAVTGPPGERRDLRAMLRPPARRIVGARRRRPP